MSGTYKFLLPVAPNSTEIKKHMTADDEYGDNWIATHAGGFGAYKVTECR